VTVTGTALWIAAARARESARPDALFSDPWAAALAGTYGQARLVASEQASARENPFLPVRTRFFDDLLTAATWAEQIVLLGAGMDTRAYRLNLPMDTVVFEVDHSDIFTPKNVVLDSITPRSQRREVRADLAGEWEAALVAAGFDAARPTGWLAEGLFFYLTEDTVRRLLRTAARLSRARALFGADIFGTGLRRLPSMQPLIHQRHGPNQPQPFCTDQPVELLAACGWRTDTLVRLGQPQANFGRLPDVPPDWDGGPDPTMCTYLALGFRHD
jgi:methyltransferase (TIGR00027 family)